MHAVVEQRGCLIWCNTTSIVCLFANSGIFLPTAAVSEVCGGENTGGRFLGFLSLPAKTPTHQVSPGEETPGNYRTQINTKDQ